MNTNGLEKIIDKAKANGWKTDIMWDGMYDQPYEPDGDGGYDPVHYREFIFNHDFAKALWGEKRFTCSECKKVYPNSLPHSGCKSYELGEHTEGVDGNWEMGWKYHLQQMVLEEDPIKYLEKFV